MTRMNQQTATARFYVYQYVDPRLDKNRAVIYVGKGTYDGGKLARMESHWVAVELKNKVFHRVLSKIRGLGLEPVRVVISWHETEREAFAAEVLNIAMHGLRKDGGTLCNLTYGGEGASGLVHNDESIAKIQKAVVAFWGDPEKAATVKNAWTPEKRTQQSNSVKRRGAGFAEKCKQAMTPERRAQSAYVAATTLQADDVVARRAVTLKQTMSDLEFKSELSKRTKVALARPDAKANQRAASKKVWEDPAHREKMLAIRSRQTTDETKRKLSETAKAAIANQSTETKKRLSEFRSNMAKERHARNKLKIAQDANCLR